jgi:Bacterial CdiA-CT RNAse A domain
VRMSVYEELALDRERARHARLRAEQARAELLRLRSDIAALRMELTFIKLQHALRTKYDPNQSRVPAGNPDGGQWTSEGGGQGTGEDDAVDTDVTGSTDSSRNDQNESQRRYSVNLVEEEARGGHTIRKHIGKSDEEMLAGAKGREYVAPGLSGHYYRHGSFRSLEDANDLTTRTLEQNREIVDEVAAGKRNKDFIKARFGFPTGREAVRLPKPGAEPYMRTTYGVGVGIRYDPRSPRGYRVHTAYPRND